VTMADEEGEADGADEAAEKAGQLPSLGGQASLLSLRLLAAMAGYQRCLPAAVADSRIDFGRILPVVRFHHYVSCTGHLAQESMAGQDMLPYYHLSLPLQLVCCHLLWVAQMLGCGTSAGPAEPAAAAPAGCAGGACSCRCALAAGVERQRLWCTSCQLGGGRPCSGQLCSRATAQRQFGWRPAAAAAAPGVRQPFSRCTHRLLQPSPQSCIF
jgi:hypothetical protein